MDGQKFALFVTVETPHTVGGYSSIELCAINSY